MSPHSPPVEWKFTAPKVKIIDNPFHDLDDLDAIVLEDEKTNIEKARKIQQYLFFCPTSPCSQEHQVEKIQAEGIQVEEIQAEKIYTEERQAEENQAEGEQPEINSWARYLPHTCQ
jgi:hypothetical protein